jgi:1-deoxy-D-xylulose-5-phosphate synthase
LEFAFNCSSAVCIRYPKDTVPSNNISACSIPFETGKSVTVKKNPDSVIAIVTYGTVLAEGLAAAERLAQQGIMVDVINARFASPVDDQIISLLSEGKGLITVEDHNIACGFGSAVLEKAATVFNGLIPKPIAVLGMPNRFIRQDLRKVQFMEGGINADNILRTAKNMLGLIK